MHHCSSCPTAKLAVFNVSSGVESQHTLCYRMHACLGHSPALHSSLVGLAHTLPACPPGLLPVFFSRLSLRSWLAYPPTLPCSLPACVPACPLNTNHTDACRTKLTCQKNEQYGYHNDGYNHDEKNPPFIGEAMAGFNDAGSCSWEIKKFTGGGEVTEAGECGWLMRCTGVSPAWLRAMCCWALSQDTQIKV